MNNFKNVADFLKALNSPEGLPGPQLSVTGFVRPIVDGKSMDEHPGASSFQFSPGTSCSSWITIPSSIVSSVDHLGTLSCGDHQHELAHVYFGRPASQEARIFHDLLRQQPSAHAVPITSAPAEFVAGEGVGHPLAAFGGIHFPHPNFPPVHFPPIHFPPISTGCELGCTAILPSIYPQAVAGLRSLKAAGIVTSHDQCKTIANNVTLLTAYYSRVLPHPLAQAIAVAVAGRCGTCACDHVF
jgi:hypothetical protein